MTWIPEPERETQRPFQMPIADVFETENNSVIVTGCVERGVVKRGDVLDIVGFRDEVMTATVNTTFRCCNGN